MSSQRARRCTGSLVAGAAVAISLSGTASAHPRAHCFGEKWFCGREGNEYVPPLFQISAAYVASKLAISDQAASDAGLVAGSAAGHGMQYRFLAGWHGIYGGGEMTMMWIDATGGEPSRPLSPQPAGGGAVMTAGTAVEMRWFAGYRRSTGSLIYGTELAAGLRWLGADGRPEDLPSGLQGVVDARGALGVWLSPHVSLTLVPGASVVRRDEYMASLVLAFSPLPWDGLR